MRISKILSISVWITCICIGCFPMYSQPSAQIKGLKNQLNAVDRMQWQKMREVQRRIPVPSVKPNEKSVPKVPDVIKTRPEIHSYDKLRFSGKTKAQINSIKRAEKEKEHFYADFLERLLFVESEINRRDSLSAALDIAILSGDSVADVLLTPELEVYAKDAVVGAPYEIALYCSFYDDMTARDDSVGAFGKYRRNPMQESAANTDLLRRIYGEDGLYRRVFNALRDRLSSDVNQYLYLYELEPFTVHPDSIDAIIALVPNDLKEANSGHVGASAELAATGNAIYRELQDVRSQSESTLDNAASLKMVRLVEMKLHLENSLKKYHGQKLPEAHVYKDIDKYIRASWKMGKYNPISLLRHLNLLLTNEFGKKMQAE